MHRKQANFSILIFITQSCTKGGKYISTAPREGPAASQAENVKRQGGLCNGLLTRKALHSCSDKHMPLLRVNTILSK